MKKIIVFLFIFVTSVTLINNKDNILIPDEAIRFRVIANSNELEDQTLKMEIKTEVEKELFELIKDANSIDDARNMIKNNLNLVKKILNEHNIEYDVNYGNNYFPEKEYKGIIYKSGNYESLVITLGEGIGDNWWCVLFPPLCMLDERQNLENTEYQFFAKELINKLK